ncbi:aldo/keto reductase [Streptomyces rapamycinicus]|uniref:Aldo/keto reductase n=2 Tax=Streptomyces rapamycinicus TaxID=1226757 RepID=A0A0A0NMS8_STRRN|nr:aldo/keto reductase [Streptomyces rapamycinicus]AGP60877.1 aldo/keto reductase [Streptomyces rapamycinicus NRRL 5491]MBB4787951.1 aryl-alcohol dehydrogenase-like predicted oxidoreductase [Streptomyces rapamycinicus]RLV72289.1 aldo/keto reductase [Streptomyces rapamycinicus NRRL 5491]UTP36415.1 aldo/keto reductase [Streptomyces rapamycinicus NRRL 5491]
MRYRRLGATGPRVSVVGLGGNNFGSRLDGDATRAVVHAALDAGITLFDTADTYGGYGGAGQAGDSERLLGAALEGRRDTVVLATKFGMAMGPEYDRFGPRGSRAYLRHAVRMSLRRLGTDYIDLYQYHEPDGVTPVAETAAALEELVAEGVVRHYGCSNMAGPQLVPGFVSTQVRYHLLDRTAETARAPAATRAGTAPLPYCPLANGLLSGKYRRGEPPPPGSRLSWRQGWLTDAALDRAEALTAYGAERGQPLLRVAVGGLAALPGVGSVICGAMTPEQATANPAAAAWIPDAADLAALDDIVAPGERVV